jgi:phenylacetate-CoA ligase
MTHPSTSSEALWVELRESIRWITKASPFYREKLGRAGIDAEALRNIDDFRSIPLTRKAEIPAAQQQSPPFGPLLAVPREEIASISISPGPLYIPRTATEPTGVEALHESLSHMGVRPDDTAHVTLSYHIMPGGLRLHRAFESFGCRVINGGVGNSEMQVRVASELKATVYAGTPSFLSNLAETAERLGRRLHYRVGFSTAEALTPQLRESLEQGLGIELFNHCGEALIGPLAGECSRHDGMHLHSREMFVEFLDPETGEPVAPGSPGELVVTQLGRRAMPLARYAPGDVFRLHPEVCACGNPATRVDFIGQVGAIRKIKGVLIHPAQVRSTLDAFPELGHFQIVIERSQGPYDQATIRIGCSGSAGDASLRARVAERLRDNLLIQMNVELVSPNQIQEDGIVDRRSK